MKLYVLIRNDLSKSQQGVQGAHAVAEWVKEWWIGEDDEWDNTLVFLRSTDINKDFRFFYDSDTFYEVEPFYEPDLDDEMTAFAILGSEGVPEMLENYRLV